LCKALETSATGSYVATQLLRHRPDLTNAPETTQKNWKLITQKGWEFTQQSAQRFQLIAEILSQFNLVYTTTGNLQKHADSKSNKDLSVFLEILVQNMNELRKNCGNLRGGANGELDILKQKAEEVLDMLGPGFEAIKSNYKQIQELNQKIGEFQERLIKLYDEYYTHYLPELQKAELSLNYQQLQAKYIDMQLDTAKEQRELLRQQLEMAKQSDREKQKVLAQQYEKRQAMLTEAHQTRQRNLAAAQAQYEQFMVNSTKDHQSRLKTFQDELSSIK